MVSTVVAVTNELSEVTKWVFTYDNPFEEMGNNLFWFKSGTFGKILFSAPVAMDVLSVWRLVDN